MSTNPNVAPRPYYKQHRLEAAGAGVAADVALAGISTRRAANFAGYGSIHGLVLITGALGSVVLELCEVVERDVAGVKTEVFVSTGRLTPTLTNLGQFDFDVHGGRFFLRLAAVNNAPTAVEVLIAGQEAVIESKMSPVLGSTWEVVQDTPADLQSTVTPAAGTTWKAIQDVPANLQVTVTPAAAASFTVGQTVAANLKSEPTQTDPTKLIAEVRQATASNFNAVVEPGSTWGAVDANNSSAVALGIGAAFTGTGTDVSKYDAICVTCITDKVSAVDGFQIQFSQDNSNWDFAYKYSLSAAKPFVKVFIPKARYFRVVLTNGAGAQVYLRLQSVLKIAAAGVGTLEKDREYYTPLTDVSITAAGGLSSAAFSIKANGVYELELLPDVLAGAATSDDAFGCFKIGADPATVYDGIFMQRGMSRRICVNADSTISVYSALAANLNVATRWKCTRKDSEIL